MSALDNEKDVKNLQEQDHLEILEHGGGGRRPTVIAENFGQYISDAADAVEHQKEQTVREALRQYRWGVLYSVVFSA